MSESFKEILYQQHPKGLMQSIYWSVFLVSIVISLTVKKRLLCIGVIGALLFSSLLLQTDIFYSWWDKLREVASTHEDQIWLADHDGGRMIVDLSLIFEAFIAGVISIIICLFFNKKKEPVKG